MQCIDVKLGSASNHIAETSLHTIAMIAASADPKYRKPVTAAGVFHNRSLADIVRQGLLSIGAILLPIGFVVQLIRRRNWSLRAFLLAPAITLLALICWRSVVYSRTSVVIPDMIAGVMAVLTIASVFFMMRHQQWRLLGLSVGLSALMGTLIMLGSQASLPLRTPGAIGYWTVGGWLSAVAGAAAQIVMPFGLSATWGLRKLAKAKQNQ